MRKDAHRLVALREGGEMLSSEDKLMLDERAALIARRREKDAERCRLKRAAARRKRPLALFKPIGEGGGIVYAKPGPWFRDEFGNPTRVIEGV